MKKILSVLLIVVLLCSISVMLFACTDKELQKLTYTDENGEEQTITIKKTADSEKVTAAVMALGAKEVDTTTYDNIVLTAGAQGACTGTQKGAAFNLEFNGNVTVGAALPDTLETYALSNIIAASKLYVGGEFTARLPKKVGEDEVPNFCDVDEYNEKAKLYLDESKLYTKLELSDTAIAAIPQMVSMFIDISAMNNKTAVVDLASVLTIADMALPAKEVAPVYKSIVNTKASYIKAIEKITAKEPKEGEEPVDNSIKFNDVKKIVEACNIQITKTKGSVVTFSAKVNKESINALIRAFDDPEDVEEDIADNDFDGEINVEVSIDAKTMLDISVSATISNAFNGLFKDIPESEEVSVSRQELTINASISTKDAVQTLSQEEKDAAVVFPLNIDLNAILNSLKK